MTYSSSPQSPKEARSIRSGASVENFKRGLNMAETTAFSLEEIKKILPHRYPFLLVDRVISMTEGPDPRSCEGRVLKAIKNVTVNEEFFNGHFPHKPIMPGVMILEAMAQAGALANHQSSDPDMEFMIASISDAKFRKPVVPGDQLVLHAEIEKVKGKIKKINCKAEVDGKIVAEAQVMAVAQPLQQN